MGNAADLLESVGKGMTEIQQLPFPCFLFVAAYHLAFGSCTYGDDFPEYFRISRQGRFKLSFQEAEKIRLHNGPVFHHLCKSHSEFGRLQGIQHRGIAEDEIRLTDHPDHIFVAFEIHPVLSSDAGIHLGQQGSGHETERKSPQEG